MCPKGGKTQATTQQYTHTQANTNYESKQGIPDTQLYPFFISLLILFVFDTINQSFYLDVYSFAKRRRKRRRERERSCHRKHINKITSREKPTRKKRIEVGRQHKETLIEYTFEVDT